MKVIDLLNKIANGEEVPKIKYDKKVWIFKKGISRFLEENDLYNIGYFGLEELNDEVEIIEEEKKIPEKLKSLNNVGNVPNLVEFADKQQLNNHLIKDKLNEAIDYLDYLKSKGDE